MGERGEPGRSATKAGPSGGRAGGRARIETAPAAPRPSFTEDRLARLRRAVGRTARGLRHTAGGAELTPTQVEVLATIARTGPVRPSELAAAEQLHPTMLSRIAGKLEAAGLVERLPDPADGRAAALAVTPEGAARAAQVRHERTEALRAAVGRLDPATRHALAEAVPALEALAEAIQQGRA